MGPRNALLIAYVVCALLLPMRALAGSLQWTAAEGCPDALALQAELERVLSDPERVLAAFDLEGVVVRDQSGSYTLWLQMWSARMGDKPAVRELQGATCQELLEAAAVAVALAVEATSSDVAAMTPDTASSEVVAIDSEKPGRPPARSSLATPPAPAAAVAWLLGASAVIDTAALPTTGLGAQLQLAFTSQMLRLGLGGGWLPARSVSFGGGGTRWADFGLLFGQALGCGQLPLGAGGALAYACGAFELGRLSASLEHSSRGRTGSAWRALGFGVGGSLPLGSPLALAGSFDLLFPLTRPVFLVDGASVFQSPRVAWRAQLRLIFSL